MSRGKAMHQMSMQMELALEGRDEVPVIKRSGEAGRVTGRAKCTSCGRFKVYHPGRT